MKLIPSHGLNLRSKVFQRKFDGVNENERTKLHMTRIFDSISTDKDQVYFEQKSRTQAFNCDHCGRNFFKKLSLMAHVKIHRKYKTLLNNHMPKSKVNCAESEMKFLNSYSSQLHLKSRRKRIFKQKENLKDGQSYKVNEEINSRPKLLCQYCGRLVAKFNFHASCSLNHLALFY